MKKEIKEWCGKNFYYLLVIFLVMVGWIIMFTSIAIGQETLEAEIKNGQVVIYKTTKIQTEIIPLPDKEFGISDENAKKVCLAEERAITITEEIEKKINFVAFPFAKTKTILQKEIWHDKQIGWQTITLKAKKISENFWALTYVMIVIFFSFLLPSWLAWRNKKIKGLFRFYFFIILSCLFFAIYTTSLSGWAIAITLMLGLVFSLSACVASVNIISQKDDPGDFSFFVLSSVAILIIFNIILAIVTTTYNSAPEFLSALLLMMATTCFIGWLLSLGKINIKLKKANADNSDSSLHK